MLRRIKNFFTGNSTPAPAPVPVPVPKVQKPPAITPTLSSTNKKWFAFIGLAVGLIGGGLTVGWPFAVGWTLKTAGIMAAKILGCTVAGGAVAATASYLPEIAVTLVNTVTAPLVGDVLTTEEQLQAKKQIHIAHQQNAQQNANDRQRNEQNTRLLVMGNMVNHLEDATQKMQRQEQQSATEAQKKTVLHKITQTDSVSASLVINTPNSFMPGQSEVPISPTANGSEIRQRGGFAYD